MTAAKKNSAPTATEQTTPEQATAATTSATPEPTLNAEAAAVPPAPTTFTFAITGEVTGTVQVPADTTVKDAIRKISESAPVTSLTLRDGNSKPVGADRLIRENLVVTSVKKAAGG